MQYFEDNQRKLSIQVNFVCRAASVIGSGRERIEGILKFIHEGFMQYFEDK